MEQAKIYIVGIGPGSPQDITPAVIGYQMAVFWIGGAIILGGALAAATLGGKLAGPHAAPAEAKRD